MCSALDLDWDLFNKLSPLCLCPLRQYPVSYCTAAPAAAACWQCWILPVTVEFNYLCNEITRYIIFKYKHRNVLLLNFTARILLCLDFIIISLFYVQTFTFKWLKIKIRNGMAGSFV